jgi:hypothetical protein
MMANQMFAFAKSRLMLVVVLAGAGCAGCWNPLNPEAGLPVPKDPGTVVVRVSDQAAAPMRDVRVQVHDLPNSVGSVYSVGQSTDAGGSTTIRGIPAGRRRVEVMTLPVGYTADPADLVKPVDVMKNASVTVSFVLTKK